MEYHEFEKKYKEQISKIEVLNSSSWKDFLETILKDTNMFPTDNDGYPTLSYEGLFRNAIWCLMDTVAHKAIKQQLEKMNSSIE